MFCVTVNKQPIESRNSFYTTCILTSMLSFLNLLQSLPSGEEGRRTAVGTTLGNRIRNRFRNIICCKSLSLSLSLCWFLISIPALIACNICWIQMMTTELSLKQSQHIWTAITTTLMPPILMWAKNDKLIYKILMSSTSFKIIGVPAAKEIHCGSRYFHPNLCYHALF